MFAECMCALKHTWVSYVRVELTLFPHIDAGLLIWYLGASQNAYIVFSTTNIHIKQPAAPLTMPCIKMPASYMCSGDSLGIPPRQADSR
jgi:hypothetical protein